MAYLTIVLEVVHASLATAHAFLTLVIIANTYKVSMVDPRRRRNNTTTLASSPDTADDAPPAYTPQDQPPAYQASAHQDPGTKIRIWERNLYITFYALLGSYIHSGELKIITLYFIKGSYRPYFSVHQRMRTNYDAYLETT
ncbi:hypothetical protein MGYG_07572 [Nannizzia gypsea CBS 118893]|uniref:Uncharacterized protein n=1 Tax=Arthroderma gypseum (strain ATCC MYA-4604 / CBS 118893) TaxID=535722 RepID=E4V3J2_ARTGP|nr:hypothetical protein MGYG_07572 [Nannizzia gypsea CBS 118893]EFR04566.1 hypothetical protein MGYG_07572 [Nannizzia gypsea CBS 118893]